MSLSFIVLSGTAIIGSLEVDVGYLFKAHLFYDLNDRLYRGGNCHQHLHAVKQLQLIRM